MTETSIKFDDNVATNKPTQTNKRQNETGWSKRRMLRFLLFSMLKMINKNSTPAIGSDGNITPKLPLGNVRYMDKGIERK